MWSIPWFFQNWYILCSLAWLPTAPAASPLLRDATGTFLLVLALHVISKWDKGRIPIISTRLMDSVTSHWSLQLVNRCFTVYVYLHNSIFPHFLKFRIGNMLPNSNVKITENGDQKARGLQAPCPRGSDSMWAEPKNLHFNKLSLGDLDAGLGSTG